MAVWCARSRNGTLAAGHRKVTWDGRNDAGVALSSGTYFYRITADGKTMVRKMQLVK
jgi:flagellar hook assembly protein FlgD